MDKLYEEISYGSSRLVTRRYSTSFSIGIRCFHPRVRNAVYAIYGFVRLADEIVDSLHEYDREALFCDFVEGYYTAAERGISMNPVVNAFVKTVRTYGIDDELIQAFFRSMRWDLGTREYGQEEFEEYIYGSAEVIGLMCLKVFVDGDTEEYEKLKPYARRLGAGLQKINFLRDLRHDSGNLHRMYFPQLRDRPLDEENKKRIMEDIYEDFRIGKEGIDRLPSCARLGVYTAYLYYMSLTRRIERMPARELMQKRVRVPNGKKLLLLGRACLSTRFSSRKG